VSDGLTVTSLPASFLQKISAATDRLRQIALNRKLSRKIEEWCKISNRVEEKSHTKRNRVKRDLLLCNTCCLSLQKFTKTRLNVTLSAPCNIFFKLHLLKLTGEHGGFCSTYGLSCLFWVEESKSENLHSAKNWQGRGHLEDPSADGRKILKWIFKKWEGIDWIDLVQNRDWWWAFMELSFPIKYGEFLD